MSALSLLLFFNGIKIKGKFINFCAASSFAIFLLHTNPNVCEPYFKPFVLWIYDRFDGVLCLSIIFSFLLIVGVIAILIDQVRKMIWNIISKKCLN